jgi:hypothetical protein
LYRARKSPPRGRAGGSGVAALDHRLMAWEPFEPENGM